VGRVSRFEVDLAPAQQLCGTARTVASDAGAVVSVAVVDAGGNLVCLELMDGAEIAGPVLARDKACTAVAHRIATADQDAAAAAAGPTVWRAAREEARA